MFRIEWEKLLSGTKLEDGKSVAGKEG